METERKNFQNELTTTSLKLIQITRTSDLLMALPICQQLRTSGRDLVEVTIASSLNKCFNGLGISFSEDQFSVLIDDIIECYPHDSIEDVQMCLRSIRQGKYGTTYGKLNMIVFNECMSKHLEEKAIAREQAMQRQKTIHNFETREEYEEAVRIGDENQKRLAKLRKEFEDKKRALNNDYMIEREKLNESRPV